MKRHSFCAFTRSLTAAVIALCPFLVRAGSPYAGVEGGANWQNPQDQDIGEIQFDRLVFRPGWAAGLVGGYSFENGLRAELELDFRSDGAFPTGALVPASDGAFYGVTQTGGIGNVGVVFKMVLTP